MSNKESDKSDAWLWLIIIGILFLAIHHQDAYAPSRESKISIPAETANDEQIRADEQARMQEEEQQMIVKEQAQQKSLVEEELRTERKKANETLYIKGLLADGTMRMATAADYDPWIRGYFASGKKVQLRTDLTLAETQQYANDIGFILVAQRDFDWQRTSEVQANIIIPHGIHYIGNGTQGTAYLLLMDNFGLISDPSVRHDCDGPIVYTDTPELIQQMSNDSRRIVAASEVRKQLLEDP